MATQPQQRWLIFQYSGTLQPDSLEANLHAAGGPFIFGWHRLDNAELHPYLLERNEYARLLKTDPAAAEAMDKPMIDKYGLGGDWYKKFAATTKAAPDLPAGPDGYPHLSWCWVNLSQLEHPDPPWTQIVQVMLEADAGVHLCLWMQHCHPDLVPLVELLQADYRTRHVSVYHKRGADAQHEFGGIGHETEAWLWQHADFRYLSPAGLVARGSARLWDTLEFDWRTIPVMHSAVTLDDLSAVLLRAERLLAQPQAGRPAADQGMPASM